MNKKDIILMILTMIVLWIILSMFYILSHDNFRQEENKDLYCKITYGEEFSYPSEAHSTVRICTKEEGNKIEGYHFTKEEQEKYCKEKFWKLNDCEERKNVN